MKTLHTSYHLIHTINLFFLLYLNLKDDNGMFRNSLNYISASLTETALLLGLLQCKDTYYMHSIVVFIISLKLTNGEYCSNTTQQRGKNFQ